MNDPFGNKLVIASQDNVKLYQEGVDILIWNLSQFFANDLESRTNWISNVLVTDESTLSDFLDIDQTKELYKASGLSCEGSTKIWIFAKEIEEAKFFKDEANYP